jgi:hypothetical protein
MRATYTDNNGFLRYEDTGKLVVKKEYTKEENAATNELYNTFKPRIEHHYGITKPSYDEMNSLEGKCIKDMEV